jgi:hypothetical protein
VAKREKKGAEKNAGSFHPIHKITKWDFLDGALVGIGHLGPILINYQNWLLDL